MGSYIYSRNSPVVYIDPDGNQTKVSGPHIGVRGAKYEVWKVNVEQRAITYNQNSGRYQDQRTGNTTEYRLRSSDSSLNNYRGNEVNYSIVDKKGNYKEMSTQNTGRVDVAGMVQKEFNPVDMDNVNATRKAGEKMGEISDATTKIGIVGGNPIIGGTGFVLGVLGTGMEMGADISEGKYADFFKKGSIAVGSEVFGRLGEKAIDTRIKNPVANKAAKIVLQESVRQITE